jgi:VanZ family protein
LGILFPIALGGLMEITQMELTQGRSGEWADFIADTIGVVVGSVIGFFMIRRILRKR